jgi:hypothetical protein
MPCSKCRCKCDNGVDEKDRRDIVLWIVAVCVLVASVMSLCECVPLLLCLWVLSTFILSKVVISGHFLDQCTQFLVPTTCIVLITYKY